MSSADIISPGVAVEREPVITTQAELEAALKRITFVNTVLDFKWRFEFRSLYEPTEHRRGWLLWVSFERPDTITGAVGRGRGRDEIIWERTTLSGVIKTAWLLVELMVRHELMEGFRFDGARIFNPHNSVLDLAKLQEAHDAKAEPAKPEQMTSCCECGEDYPRSELEDGEVFCIRCRTTKADQRCQCGKRLVRTNFIRGPIYCAECWPKEGDQCPAKKTG